MTITLPTRPSHDPAPPGRRSLRPLLTRLHFYAGVFVGPFILVAAISGLLYAATPQLEKAVYDHELTTDARGPALPLEEQIAAARTVEPDLPVHAVRPAVEPGRTTRVLFDDGRTDTSRTLAVFVDPVEGDVHGELTSYGTSGSLPIQTLIDELHRNLHLGEPGRIYSELAASWLWVIALAGLALWWTGPKRRRRLRPSNRGSARQRTLSWHGALGTWLLVGLLALSATGLTWSTYAGANVTELRAALDWTTPAVASDGGGHAGHAGHAGHGDRSQPGHNEDDMAGVAGMDMDAKADAGPDGPGVGYQAAWQAARADGLTAQAEITPPSGSSGTYVVTEIDRSWPVHQDAAAIDPHTGGVTDVERFDEWPLMAKLASWGVAIHMGLLFGVVNQVALVLLALGLITMIVWGYRMWWLRRPTRGGWPAPPARGAWRSLPRWAWLPVLAVAGLVGWCLPVLGVSLIAFLVVDLVHGVLARRRSVS